MVLLTLFGIECLKQNTKQFKKTVDNRYSAILDISLKVIWLIT